MLFESWADFGIFTLALLFALALRLAILNNSGFLLFITIALFLLLTALIFIIGPNSALQEGMGFFVWGIIDLLVYGLPLAFLYFALTVMAFHVAHRYSR